MKKMISAFLLMAVAGLSGCVSVTPPAYVGPVTTTQSYFIAPSEYHSPNPAYYYNPAYYHYGAGAPALNNDYGHAHHIS